MYINQLYFKCILSETSVSSNYLREGIMIKDPEKRIGYFQEDYGVNSSMRLMCFISLLAAIFFGLLVILLSAQGKSDGGNGIYIVFGFLIGAFAPKAIQKFAEQKFGGGEKP